VKLNSPATPAISGRRERRGIFMLVDEAEKLMCPYTGNYCVAYQCIAWRWFDPAIKNDGYCGLAGKECAE
jgi:hypothetical protein